MQANCKKPGTRPKPAKEAVAGKNSFETIAKRLECDKDKARFEAKMEKMVKAKGKK
jgi:hypothetical protein